ncbi:MAG TPA: efflux RND transporter periplasmic adaptor subunit [Prosthecobacter sp.]|nr:efflux RND transporter periplasmic adaptor subunit [Prosthecobacter sp.]
MPAFVMLRCIALAVTAAAFFLTSCERPEAASGPPRKPVVPVVVAQAARKDVPMLVRAIGRVTSPASVSVKPQVTGSILEVHFKDGQPVKKGDLLFTLDKRPFEVALDEARASLAEAEAKSANAAAQASRYESVARSGSVSRDEVESLRATAKAAQATAMVAAAAVKGAELQLAYATIQSPIDGRAGKALVTAGNVVSANQTELVVLNQIAPLEVTFSVAEQQLPAIQRAMAAGVPKVTARTSGAERKEAEGRLTFVDNTVKSTTGTLELKAAFDNEPQVLWPGQFVGLRVQVGSDQNVVVVRAAAVQSGQDSPFVFVVNADKTVDLRPVEVGRTEDDETVIQKGLEAGEQVVIDGQSRLTTGATVSIAPPVGTPAPPAAPAVQKS